MRDVQLLVLTAVASRPLPGHEIQTEIESLSGHPVGPGTLYGALRKLEDEGCIERIGTGGRGVPYGLTEQGRSRLVEQVASADRIVQRARAGLGGIAWTS